MTVELVVLTPVIVLLWVTVVFLGRAGQSFEQVRHAADQAARAASRVSHGRMVSTARATAMAELAANGQPCRDAAVSVSITAAARPGGSTGPTAVTVTVGCSIDRAGLQLLGAGPTYVSASSTEVVDRYRAP